MSHSFKLQLGTTHIFGHYTSEQLPQLNNNKKTYKQHLFPIQARKIGLDIDSVSTGHSEMQKIYCSILNNRFSLSFLVGYIIVFLWLCKSAAARYLVQMILVVLTFLLLFDLVSGELWW